MSEASLVKVVLALLANMGGWEIGTLVVVFILLPVLLVFWALNRIAKTQADLTTAITTFMGAYESQFKDFETKYDNNVLLVQNYEKLANELMTVVHLNTQAMTRLVDRIDFSRSNPKIKPKE